MITYKNISFSAKTFYGVRFEPGEVKDVPGYINSPSMIRVFKPTTKVKPNQMPLSETSMVSKRGRKPKSTEPEKDLVAEIPENTKNSEEETSNGNPS